MNKELEQTQSAKERLRRLENIRSVILANPEWEAKIGPLCMVDGLETAIDLFLALSSESMPMERMRGQGAEILSTEIPDDLGNGKVIQFAPHQELDDRFQTALHELFEQVLELLCLVNFSWIHQKAQKFTESTEYAMKRLSEFKCKFGKTGFIGPSSIEEMERIFGPSSEHAEFRTYRKSTDRIMKKVLPRDK